MAFLGPLAHLVKRFFVSILVQRNNPNEEKYLLSLLTDRETKLYFAQPLIDRIHSVQSATKAKAELQNRDDQNLVVAAALHDVGKAQANLGILGRVLATIIDFILPLRILSEWKRHKGIRKKIHLYSFHSERSADLLEEAGSSQLVITWARHHHDKSSDVPLPVEVFTLLKRSD